MCHSSYLGKIWQSLHDPVEDQRRPSFIVPLCSIHSKHHLQPIRLDIIIMYDMYTCMKYIDSKKYGIHISMCNETHYDIE